MLHTLTRGGRGGDCADRAKQYITSYMPLSGMGKAKSVLNVGTEIQLQNNTTIRNNYNSDAVLRIHDILVRIRIRIRLLSSMTLRMPKKFVFHIFFSYNSRAGTLSSVLKIEFFILHALFQSAHSTPL